MRQNEKELTLHIDWDQARDILIGWEQLVVTPYWLVEDCHGLIGWEGLVTSFFIGWDQEGSSPYWRNRGLWCILLAKGTVCDILTGWDQACYVLIGKDQG